MFVPIEVCGIGSLQDPPWSSVHILGGDQCDQSGKLVLSDSGQFVAFDLVKCKVERRISRGFPVLRNDIIYISPDYREGRILGLVESGHVFLWSSAEDQLILIEGLPTFAKVKPRAGPASIGILDRMRSRIQHDYGSDWRNLPVKCLRFEPLLGNRLIMVWDKEVYSWTFAYSRRLDDQTGRNDQAWFGNWTKTHLEQDQGGKGSPDLSLSLHVHHGHGKSIVQVATTFQCSDDNQCLILRITELATVTNPTLGDLFPGNPKEFLLNRCKSENDDISEVISEYSPDGGILALALNYESRSSNQVLIFDVRSHVILRTEVTVEDIAKLAFIGQGSIIVCLTKDEKVILVTASGLALNSRLCGPDAPQISQPWLSLRTLYDTSKTAISVKRNFLSLSILGSRMLCSNGSLTFDLKLPTLLGQGSLELVQLIQMKAELVLASCLGKNDGSYVRTNKERYLETMKNTPRRRRRSDVSGSGDCSSVMDKFVQALDEWFGISGRKELEDQQSYLNMKAGKSMRKKPT